MLQRLFSLCCTLRNLLKREEGQDLVEYALVIALVAFGSTAGMRVLGTGLGHAFTSISSTLASSLT